MSLLEDLFGGFSSGMNESENADFTPPCALCPGNCAIGPEACDECRPYKEKLTDALYNVDHLEEFLAKYEVGESNNYGTITCPQCGAPSADHYQCEYCGSKIKEGSGKIIVASANDIPDPIIEARDIIYERHSAIVSKFTQASASDSGSFLASLLGALGGAEEASLGLGTRMSKDEIKEAASHYGVSVSDYLSGLDNGKYQTYENMKREQSYGGYSSAGPGPGVGMAGGAALGGLAGLNLGGLFLQNPGFQNQYGNMFSQMGGQQNMQGFNFQQFGGQQAGAGGLHLINDPPHSSGQKPAQKPPQYTPPQHTAAQQPKPQQPKPQQFKPQQPKPPANSQTQVNPQMPSFHKRPQEPQQTQVNPQVP
ncbi:MAG: hypothetical protein IKR21_04580, partial [Oscillospiraceae bacterium]|nr:hypothetical protein [Oscillospiraceae bacterium]